MKIFDEEQVASTLAPLKARFVDCAHGEGNACETLDAHLECCARICFDVVMACRAWALDVFRGEVVFDPAAENAWRTELAQMHARAIRAWHVGRKAETPCWDLPGLNRLSSAVQELQWLVENWVTPQPSVGPMARVNAQLGDEQKATIRAQLASLPPLELADHN